MASSNGGGKRNRGEIVELPSGSLRVRVYTGVDPVSKRRHYLTETIPAGPKARKLAEQVRTRFINQVNEQRHPRTNTTVDQLMERHLKLLDESPKAGPSWVAACRGYHRRHISPFVGHMKVGALGADVLDSLYAEAWRCRIHCDRRPFTEHRTTRPHRCDEHETAPCKPADPECHACRRRCQPHQCRPLGNATVRQIHFLLHGAYKRAVRWKWVTVNPIDEAEPPDQPTPEPRPTTAGETARIINAAWSADPDFGSLVWIKTATGARRGEMCALQFTQLSNVQDMDGNLEWLDFDRPVLTLNRAVANDGQGNWYIKDTKTHQPRRAALDGPTVTVLRAQWERFVEKCAALGIRPRRDAFVFSLAPDHSTFLIPDSVSQRYDRLVARLGIDTTLKALRHYSATELIAAGIDVRTVAGRLGHSGGGVTTLRVYVAFLEEADQRAAGALSPRMPPVPEFPVSPAERAMTDPRTPHERIAVGLREWILAKDLRQGSPLPPMADIAQTNGVSISTARRAVMLLRAWGLAEVTSGRRTTVARRELVSA